MASETRWRRSPGGPSGVRLKAFDAVPTLVDDGEECCRDRRVDDAERDRWAAFGIAGEGAIEGLRAVRNAARERGRARIEAFDD